MQEELDFTIVTASYNYSKYVRLCVESVLEQEGVSYEHIIFDAGSTDGTLEILAEYDHLDLTVEPDKGMSDAINKGFRKAKGKWVMWLNTDDYLLPGTLAKVKAFAESHADADVLYGGWNFIDAEGNRQKMMSLFPFQKMMMTHYYTYIGSTACFYRRSTVIDEGHLLNERFKYVMDGEHYCRLASLGKKFVYIPDILADFRIHGENISFRDLNDIDIDGALTKQYQMSESTAIRRAYGVTNFQHEQVNRFLDTILYYFFKGLKFILVRWHRKSLKPQNEG